MKTKTRYIGLGILGLFLVLAFPAPLFSNLWAPFIGNSSLVPGEGSTFPPGTTIANTKTAPSLKIPCGDVLLAYAEKPQELEFIGCERVKNSQTLVRAMYRVSGKKSKEVEDFLVENYGMGRLEWTCCGWSNGGKYGQFDHAQFKKIDKYCSALIEMHASGEIADKNAPTGTKLETDRNKIAYFTVVVEVAIF